MLFPLLDSSTKTQCYPAQKKVIYIIQKSGMMQGNMQSVEMWNHRHMREYINSVENNSKKHINNYSQSAFVSTGFAFMNFKVATTI